MAAETPIPNQPNSGDVHISGQSGGELDIGNIVTGTVGGDVIGGHKFVFNYIPPDPHIPYQAPGLPPHFVARAEIGPLKEALLSPEGQTLALTALHGMGGLGKTTLAIALAREAGVVAHFKDGVLWANLGPEAGAGVVEKWQATWGRALGDDLRSYADTATKAARLRTLLADKTCLVIIDDIWPDTNLTDLLVGGPNCRTLLTTRHGKVAQLRGVKPVELNVLNETEALTLLYSWAGWETPAQEESEEHHPEQHHPQQSHPERSRRMQAVELVKRLGYLPIAVTLAGAQLLDGATLPELLAAFQARQGDLSALDLEDPRTKKESLTLTFDLSYKRLAPTDQSRFAQLGVFAANEPFDVAAAGAVWNILPPSIPPARGEAEDAQSSPPLRGELEGGDTSASQGEEAEDAQSPPPLRGELEGGEVSSSQTAGGTAGGLTTISKHLRLLTRHALLTRQLTISNYELPTSGNSESSPPAPLPPDTPAYTLHPLLRDYARSHLPETDRDDAAERHTAHYLTIAQNSKEDWQTAEKALGQIQTAWERVVRAEDEQVFTFTFAMQTFFERRGLWNEWLVWAKTGLGLATKLNDKQKESYMLGHIGYTYRLLGRWDESLDHYQRALDMDQELDNKAEIAIKLNNIAGIYWSWGDLDQALDHFQQALDISRELGDKAGIAIRLNNIGIIYEDRGDLDLALDHFQQALDISRELGDKAGIAIRLNNIGRFYWEQGDLDQALDHFQQALDTNRELGNKVQVAVNLNNIARIYQDQSDLDLALDHFQHALDSFEAFGDKASSAVLRNNIGMIYGERGDLDQALDHYRQALNIDRELGNKPQVAIRLLNIGAVHVRQERFVEAEQVLVEAVGLFEALGSPIADTARWWLEKARKGLAGE